MRKTLFSIATIAVAALSSPALAACPGDGCYVPPVPDALELQGYFEFPTTDPQNYYVGGGISTFTLPLPNAMPSVTYTVSGNPGVHFVSTTGYTVLGDADGGVAFAVTLPNQGSPSLGTVAQKTLANNANVSMSMFYTIKLSAPDMAAADQIALTLGQSTKAGTISGNWGTTLSGVGSATVIAVTTNPQSFGGSFRKDCTAIPGTIDASGCGTGGYSLDFGFVRGDQYSNGSALDFYSRAYLNASSYTYFDGSSGSVSAYIDPTIRLNSSFRGISGLTLTSGGAATALAFVPEPASWALMIGGFGFAGGYARTRRSLKLA
ncbi:hypothetical protein SPAN111604_12165 [Sphingomonas antarctica]|uniref:PEPxxWA-CTERM sorting domain-containing protein n=1 Tax=Sphingomonas antarctica TaxID=2040274 RepID=UPI0039EA42BD